MAKRDRRRAGDVSAEQAAEPRASEPQASDSVATDATASFVMLDRMRAHVGEPSAPTRAAVMRDLEAAKRLAFEGINVAGGVRAIELQGKSIGAFAELDPAAELRNLTDEELCADIARGNQALADALLQIIRTGTLGPGLEAGPL